MHLSLFRQLLLLPSMAMVAGSDLSRLVRMLNATEAEHPHEAHYYLPIIGVAPVWLMWREPRPR